MLIDDELLSREGEGWVPTRSLEDVSVPPTISALLSARLDRLSAPERALLEAAAVSGKEFHRGAVVELLPEPARPEADVQLRSLVRKELVGPVRSLLPGEDAYRFRHLLIRDAAYDAIPKHERARSPRGVRRLAGTGSGRSRGRAGRDRWVSPRAGVPAPGGAWLAGDTGEAVARARPLTWARPAVAATSSATRRERSTCSRGRSNSWTPTASTGSASRSTWAGAWVGWSGRTGGPAARGGGSNRYRGRRPFAADARVARGRGVPGMARPCRLGRVETHGSARDRGLRVGW